MHGTLVSMLYVAAWQKNLFENEVYMIEDIQRKSFTLDTLASLAKWLSVLLRTSGCGSSPVDASCSHLNFRYRACFEQGVPSHSGNYRVWIHSKVHVS